jgi:hypothetical protein
LPILEATQAAFGFLPVSALKRISERTGTWYAQIYGTASYYGHLRFEPPAAKEQAAAISARRATDATYLEALGTALGGGAGDATRATSRPARRTGGGRKGADT